MNKLCFYAIKNNKKSNYFIFQMAKKIIEKKSQLKY